MIPYTVSVSGIWGTGRARYNPVSTVSGALTGARAPYPVSTVSRRKPRHSRIYRISGSRGPYLPCTM
eukprot:scaffold175608_cov32-Tisochrysis_lutea.AAC.1